jgi:dTDP-4-amino-4,6-dideoxy-D-galactose acyltransferase
MSATYYQLHELNWDTEFFGSKMGEIQLDFDEEEYDFSEAIWRRTLEVARKQNFQFLLCQFDTRYQEITTILSTLGASIGDVLLTFRCDLSQPLNISEKSEQIHICKAVQADLPEIIEIAANSFTYSRFFQDPRFDEIKVQQFYPNWISDSFMTIEKVYVLKEQNEIQGFISMQTKPDQKRAVISLVAVRSTRRSQGIGQALINWVIQNYAEQGFREIQVGTQVNNYSAIRLYEKNGFRLIHAKYRFHIWLDNLDNR